MAAGSAGRQDESHDDDIRRTLSDRPSPTAAGELAGPAAVAGADRPVRPLALSDDDNRRVLAVLAYLNG